VLHCGEYQRFRRFVSGSPPEIVRTDMDSISIFFWGVIVGVVLTLIAMGLMFGSRK